MKNMVIKPFFKRKLINLNLCLNCICKFAGSSSQKSFCSFSDHGNNFFSVQLKDSKIVSNRLDKLNILEYFNLLRKRQSALLSDILLCELEQYFHSINFKTEFQSQSGIGKIIKNDIEFFRFFLLHVNLLSYILSEMDSSLETKLLVFKLNNLSLSSSESFLNFYISKNFHLKIQSGYSLVIQKELATVLMKEETKYKKNFRTYFLKELNKEELNTEEIEEFNERISQFLYNNEEKINKKKFYDYFSAHRNYLKSLKLNEIKQNKIHWGLEKELLIE